MTLEVHSVTLFGIDMNFDSVAFTLPFGGGWSIYWYGICIAVGFLLAVLYCFYNAKKFGIDVDRLTDVVLVTTPVAILCARIYYVIFYDGENSIKSIKDFIGLGGGSGVSGLAIYGGIIGAGLCGFLMCKIRKINILDSFDLASMGFLIGQACGRWGNFFNQEAYGTPTGSSFWGMTNKEGLDGVLVHPCFLYESVWCILGFVLLHILNRRRKFKGQLALTYLVWYGIGRAVIEGLRTDSLYIGPLRVSQWLSVLLVIVGATLLIYNFRKLKSAKVDSTYKAVFDEIDPDYIKGVDFYEGETAKKSEISNIPEDAEKEEISDSDSVKNETDSENFGEEE